MSRASPIFMISVVLLSACSLSLPYDPRLPKPVYTQEDCRRELENELLERLNTTEAVKFYDERGKAYRALDIKVELSSEPHDKKKDITVFVRSTPLAYWGFDPFAHTEVATLASTARALLDTYPFVEAHYAWCPPAPGGWSATLFGGPPTETATDLVFDKLLMFWGIKNYYTDTMEQFQLASKKHIVPALTKVQEVYSKQTERGVVCQDDMAEFFSESSYTTIWFAVGVACVHYDEKRQSRAEAAKKLEENLLRGRFLLVASFPVTIRLTKTHTEEKMRAILESRTAHTAHTLYRDLLQLLLNEYLEEILSL